MTPEREIWTRWAIIRPDGDVAGDGEDICIFTSRQEARDERRICRARLERINGTRLRVARVRLTEISPPLPAPATTEAK